MRKSRSASLRRLAWMGAAAVAVLTSTVAAQDSTTSRDSTAFYRGLEMEGAGNFRDAATLFRRSLRSSSAVSAILGLERAYAELHWSASLLAPLDSLIAENPHEPVYRTVQLRTLETLGRHADVQ